MSRVLPQSGDRLVTKSKVIQKSYSLAWRELEKIAILLAIWHESFFSSHTHG
jgi:hypothetical protein